MRGLTQSALGGLLTLLLAAPPALASSARTFSANLPVQPVRGALLDLAVQARVSLGGDVASCTGTSPRLTGSIRLDAALGRVLSDSNCIYQIRPDGAVIIRRIVHTAPTAAATPPAIAHPTPAPVTIITPMLSDVIVTAGRSSESPQTTPTALTAFTGQQIIDSGAVGASDLSALVAGMTVTNLGSGRNKILLRGMSDGAFTGQTQSTVGLYLNRVPLTYSAPDPDLKLIDINRVEVVRGPQGVLYGTGPIGGVLRIVPEAPDTEKRLLTLSAGYADTQGGDPSGETAIIGNLPVFNGRGAVRLAGYDEKTGGYIDDEALNLRRVNNGRRSGGRLSYILNLSPEWTLSGGGVGQQIKTEDTHYIYRTVNGARRENLVREPHENIFGMGYARLVGNGDWGRLEATAARVSHSFVSRYDASTGLRFFGSNGRIGALDDHRDIDLDVLDIAYSSPRGQRLRWLTGLFWSDTVIDNSVDLTALWPTLRPVYSEQRRDQQHEFAGFAQATYDLTDDLSLIVGGRYYVFDYETASMVRQGGDERPFDGRGRTSGFSPKLALSWRPDDNWSFYGQISQGHRAGGFNTAGPINDHFTNTVVKPLRAYGGDSLWNYEFGAKGVMQDGRIQMRAALFYADWRNLQSDQFLPSGLSYTVNVGDGANTGLEIEANWRPTENLEIRSNALLTDPRLIRSNPMFSSRGNAGLPGVPAVSTNIKIGWRRPMTDRVVLIADGSVAYVGSSRLTFDAEKRHKMGDYVTARASIGVETGRWRASAYVTNPFNTSANTFAFGDPFRLPEALTTTPLRPRTIGLNLTWTTN